MPRVTDTSEPGGSIDGAVRSDGLLPVTAAAKRGRRGRKLDGALLAAAVERGDIRVASRTPGGRPLLDPRALDEDLAKLLCRADGCERVALGETRICRDHVSSERLTGRAVPPEARAKMSASHHGKTLSPEHKAAISASLRGEWEERTCPVCESTFSASVGSDQVCCGLSCSSTRRWQSGDREARCAAIRRAVAHRSVAPSERRHCEGCGGDLGVIPGSRLLAGRGRFHFDCWHRHLKENPPQHFGGWNNKSGRVVVCPGCSKARWQRPSKQGTGWCRRCRGKLPEVLEQLAALHRAREAEVSATIERRSRDVVGLSVSQVSRDAISKTLPARKVVIRNVPQWSITEVDARTRERRLAKGPAWNTRLNPDWQVQRARADGTLADLVAHGLTEQQAEAAVRQPVEARRAALKPRRRGFLAADEPSPTNRERYNGWLAAERLLGDEGPLEEASKRTIARRAARVLAEERPSALPRGYVENGQLIAVSEEDAIRLLLRAEASCKSA